MTTDLFAQLTAISKAHAYDIVAQHNKELVEIRDQLLEALTLALHQLDDPDEDINSIRDHAAWAIERARRI
jgi:hypothetical protein